MHIWRRKAPFRFNARLIVARLAERLASGLTLAAHAKASTLGHASRHALHVLPHMHASVNQQGPQPGSGLSCSSARPDMRSASLT